jgi:hypothetical protein
MPTRPTSDRRRPPDITSPRVVIDLIDGIGKDLRQRLDVTRDEPMSDDLRAILGNADDTSRNGR